MEAGRKNNKMRLKNTDISLGKSDVHIPRPRSRQWWPWAGGRGGRRRGPCGKSLKRKGKIKCVELSNSAQKNLQKTTNPVELPIILRIEGSRCARTSFFPLSSRKKTAKILILAKILRKGEHPPAVPPPPKKKTN